MAAAATITIVQVSEIVEPVGDSIPEASSLPVSSSTASCRLPGCGPLAEQVRPEEHATVDRHRLEPLDRDELARWSRADIPPGSYVNLGIGQPTRSPTSSTRESGSILHTENGMLGMGPGAYGDDDRPGSDQRRQDPGTETARRRVLPPR